MTSRKLSHLSDSLPTPNATTPVQSYSTEKILQLFSFFFGLLYVMSRKQPALERVVHEQTTVLLIKWKEN